MGMSFFVGLGFVIENVQESVSDLKKVCVPGHEICFKRAGEAATAVISYVLSCQVNGNFHCNRNGIIDEHEALQCFMPFLVAWRNWKHQSGSTSCVIFFAVERRP